MAIRYMKDKEKPAKKRRTSCKAVLDGVVANKGRATLEYYWNKKPVYYCYGYIDPMYDEPIDQCASCRKHVRFAQDDYDKLIDESKGCRAMDRIMAGDTVFHRPTGETWVVCGVNHDRGELIPCGWPFPSLARLDDCELVEKRKEPSQPEEYVKALRSHGFLSYIEKDGL